MKLGEGGLAKKLFNVTPIDSFDVNWKTGFLHCRRKANYIS